MRDPGIAPLWLRVGAGVIDAAVYLPALAAGGVLAWWRLKDRVDVDETRAAVERLRELRVRLPIEAAFLTLRIARRGRPSLGCRVVGIREVDARTGAPPSVRSVLVARVVELVWGWTAALLARGELTRLRERAQADAGAGCARVIVRILPGLLVPLLVALRSPRRQTPAQRLAGVVTIRDRRR